MKKTFILFIYLICICSIFGQNIKVEYNRNIVKQKSLLYVVNGVNCGQFFFEMKDVENIDIIHKDALVNEKEYDGIILIILKDRNHKPQPISLENLKNKYTDLENKPVIFMINDNLIKEKAENYFVDENNIFKIVVNKTENSETELIRILTKTEKNIQEDEDLFIR